MKTLWHKVYIASMATVVSFSIVYLASIGYSYYKLPLEERFYHPKHDWFKPSGIYGHGLGIAGTLLMMFGVGIYIARKRYNFMSRFLKLKYLLEFHIFLCVLGPVFIVFHTAFKFGGIVSIAFWCMVAVVASGVIGRFIYIQIPRNIQGQALSINDLKLSRVELSRQIKSSEGMDDETYDKINSRTAELLNRNYSILNPVAVIKKLSLIADIKSHLVSRNIPQDSISDIIGNLRKEITLNQRMARLEQMKEIFKYWHVAHLPFALVMLIIVVVHVVVTLAFGYKWIF